ncbi:MAG: hypothetical protein PHF44_02905 [Candidatus Pacebacteria bacterium]|nr:hypothetical protein [Candidatus Paceibacterota bacterium]
MNEKNKYNWGEEGEKEVEQNNQRKNNSYGKKILIFVVLYLISNAIIKNNSFIKPHSLSAPAAFFYALFVSTISVILSFGIVYFVVLAIIDSIGKRGGIERPENKKVRLIVNIIFAILIVGGIYAIIISLLHPLNS